MSPKEWQWRRPWETLEAGGWIANSKETGPLCFLHIYYWGTLGAGEPSRSRTRQTRVRRARGLRGGRKPGVNPLSSHGRLALSPSRSSILVTISKSYLRSSVNKNSVLSSITPQSSKFLVATKIAGVAFLKLKDWLLNGTVYFIVEFFTSKLRSCIV